MDLSIFPKNFVLADLAYLIEQFKQDGGKDKKISLSRGDFLIRSGEKEKYAYLILSGTFRIFYVSEHEEHTIRFGYSGEVITALPSFFNQRPTELFIQAIKKAELIRISREEFFNKVEEDPDFKETFMQILMDLIRQQQEREIDLLTQSPMERFNRVMQRSPRLFQEIPAKYIASYLRMTPETLSRLRSIDLDQ